MVDGSNHDPGMGGLSRRAFVARVAATTGATLTLGGCFSRCSSNRSAGPVQPPEPVLAPEVRPALPRREPHIRVRIATVRSTGARASSESTPLTIDADAPWLRVRTADSPSHGLILKPPIAVSRNEVEWLIRDANGFSPLTDGLQTVMISPDADPQAHMLVGDRRYAGALHLVARTEGAAGDFDVVNHTVLESYLPGVLSKELFSHWHDETFAAQAIAARSFACVEVDFWRARRHYDVTNTQQSQVFGGMASHDRALRATARTRGVVLSWRNALVPGYYSSCCGGVAANATDAISENPINDIPSLRSRVLPDACTGAPVYRWTIERSIHEVTRRLNAYGVRHNHAQLRDFGLVSAIEVGRTNRHARPTMFLIRDAGSTSVELPATRFVEAMDFSGMGLDAPKEAMRSSFVLSQVTDGRVVYTGRGFGHGVGLCQYGAQALAERGVRYKDVLESYYPESSLTPAYV